MDQLKSRFDKNIKSHHLKDLLADQERSKGLLFETEHFLLDLTRQKVDADCLTHFQSLYDSKAKPKISSMLNGDKINITENREVLHFLLRDNFENPLSPALHNHPEIKECRERVKKFSKDIRSGKVAAFENKFESIISIGIGGSYLGVECVYEALRMNPEYTKNPENLKLYFLSNVDPACFGQLFEHLDLKKTLFIVVSKSFTTAETLQNFLLCVDGFKKAYASQPELTANEIISTHFCAISTNIKKCIEYGISEERIFPMWDWVGGRFSISSAVGGLPLSLALSNEVFEQFLEGMHWMDKIFFKEHDIRKNIPALLALLDNYHNHIENYTTKAIIPYSHGLQKLPAHIQQVEMESNGKRYNTLTKSNVSTDIAKFVFGEPGTNSQHSFFQLLHQGRVSPVEFIGFCNPQVERYVVNDNDCFNEFIANIFAQADALAIGKESEEAYKLFTGDRPSLVLLFNGKLTAFNTGILLAMYEHRIETEGFINDINSFDQFGVELGKKLANDYKSLLVSESNKIVGSSNVPAQHLISYYNKNAKFDKAK